MDIVIKIIFTLVYSVINSFVPELNAFLFILIGKMGYESRLMVIPGLSLNLINFSILIIHLWYYGRKLQWNVPLKGLRRLLYFTAWLLVSALLFTEYPDYSLEKILSILVVSILPALLLVIRIKILGKDSVRLFTGSVYIVALGMSFLAIIHLVSEPGLYRMSVLGGGPIGLARIMGYGMIASYFLWRWGNFPKLPVMKMVRWSWTIFLFIMLLTFTKAPLISLFITCMLYFVIHRNKYFSTKKGKLLFSAGMITILSVCLAMDVIRQMMNPEISIWMGSYVVRINHIINAFYAFIQSPVWGVGLGNFQDYGNNWLYPHNLILEILSEAGIIGFVLFVYYMFPVYKFNWRKKIDFSSIFFFFTIFIFLNEMFSSDIIGARFLWFYSYLSLAVHRDSTETD